MKKITKKALMLSVSAFPVMMPMFIATSCSVSTENRYMTGKGSNSVSPIIMDYAMKNSPSSYTYSNTGSSDGYKSQAADKIEFDFGMTSSLKVPGTQRSSAADNLKDIDNWTKNHIRTLTWAIDAIALGIHLPKDIKINNDETPIIDPLKLFDLFKGQSVTWEELLLNETTRGSHKIRVIYIRGGAETSGKSEAFTKGLMKNALVKNSIHLNDNEKHKFETHDYKMSNSIAFDDDFAKIYDANDKTEGTLAYYALGQISTIEERFKNSNGVQIPIVKGFGLDNSIPTSDDVKTKTYKWTRPFNMIYSVDNKKSIEFAKWLISNKVQDVIGKYFVKLKQDDRDMQLNNITKPDFTSSEMQGLFDKPNLETAKSIKLGLEV